MSQWEAPRIAYELAADWAARWQEVTAGRPQGVLDSVPGEDAPPIGKQWNDLARAEQREVLDVLGVQVRSAIYEVRRLNNLDSHAQFVLEDTFYTHQVCYLARQIVPELIKPVGPRTWDLPACPHCAALIATALIHTHVVLIAQTGVPDPAVVLRQITSNLSLPAQEARQ